MKSAYNESMIYSLHVIKAAKHWQKHNLIDQEQLLKIQEQYKTPLFHPNIAIRILLFLATLLAASGMSGLVSLAFAYAGETVLSFVFLLLGGLAFVVLEKLFIANNHFRSGVTDAITYLACGFVIGGISGLTDFENVFVNEIVCLVVFGFAAYRYLDLIITLAFVAVFAWTIFYHCYEAGGILRNIIPFVFMLVFSALNFFIRKQKQNINLRLWDDNLLVLELCCLLLVYAGGNYLVVRELSVSMMDLQLQAGEDIPFAFVFYFFTVVLPVAYITAGIKLKDRVLLRMGLVAVACSVFTFKYYYSLGHPEITLMIAGILSIVIAVWLMRYLKEMRHGFTSENILSSRWANMNVEAFIISQTTGGNQPNSSQQKEMGGGGSFGGGGSSDSF